jgi:hypothetical protein
MVHPHILYCLNIYSGTSQKNLQPIRIKQKQAIRCITGATFNQHTAPLFRDLDILPLDELILFEKLKFMHKFVNLSLPPSFLDMWSSNEARQGIRELRNRNDLHVPAHHFETLVKMPLFSFAKAWNECDDTKLITNATTFKICLKSNLLNQIPV